MPSPLSLLLSALVCRSETQARRPAFGGLSASVIRLSMHRIQMEVMQAKQFGSKCTAPYCFISIDGFATAF
jgi:hypothetical protein